MLLNNLANLDFKKKCPPQLPLLEKTVKAFPHASLNDVYVICAQHLLRTSTVLFFNLFNLGLSPKNFSVIGKCYSTDPKVYFELKHTHKLDVCSSSQQFDPSNQFDNQYEENIKKFFTTRLNKILNSGCKKLIVIDDGGILIDMINEQINLNKIPADIKVIGVEQTSSGFSKLQSISLNFPVINVARSWVKLSLEASLISEAICNSLLIALKELHLSPKTALILGKGALGSKVEEKLSLYYNVDSYDPSLNTGSIGHFDDIQFKNYDLIIGCSGKESFKPENFHLLRHGTVLASGSSSDREFCASYLRTMKSLSSNCHEHLNITGVYLLNSGFPVNFSNHYEVVDSDCYQLTRSLLLAGILQACASESLLPNFEELSPDVQQLIYKEFLMIYPNFLEKPSKSHKYNVEEFVSLSHS